jgi:hypothetical protein
LYGTAPTDVGKQDLDEAGCAPTPLDLARREFGQLDGKPR